MTSAERGNRAPNLLAYGIIAEFMGKGCKPEDSQDIICEGLRGSISLSALMCGFNNRVERERRETCSFSPVILSNVNLQQLSEDATAKHDVKQIFVQSKSDLPEITSQAHKAAHPLKFGHKFIPSVRNHQKSFLVKEASRWNIYFSGGTRGV